MNDQFSFTNVKWITMGMGYGGSLAVWMRVRHPELVSFASGSSAPIQAQVDFSEYLEVVMNSINITNSTCASSIQSGFDQVSQLMQTGVGRASLKSTFNICEDLNSNNASFITKFWETIITPYMSIVESTDIGGAEINITNALCYFHYDNSTPVLTRMANVNDFYYSRIVGNDDCNSIDYDAYIQPLQNCSYNDDRAWLWQLCTEFGFFHSTSSKTAGPFFGGQDKVPISYYTQQCTDIFGADYSADYLANAVAKTNSKYGGRDYLNATFVILPNGSFDPWSPLSKLTSTDGTVVPIIMNRASHEADIYPPIVTDSNDLINGRTKIQAQLNLWLRATNN
ncbi:hypothetical protein WR25_15138 [Diploscapter pachys]|uniref:Serine carboxypeptidase S28 n=1 Tax=Diploscapter pachys TaxID=2018661 RepID=A0A2A2K4J5_9BILA|nr:hypothetical protein WR25_15138 [Diploscapter pachys]